MTNQQLLVAISDMLDKKLDEKLEEKLDKKLDEKLEVKLKELEVRLEEKLDRKLDEKLDKKFDEQLDKKFDEKLEPINRRLVKIELTQENEILPRLQNIETCYTDTYRRYSRGIEQMEALQTDVDILKKVVSEHSKRIPQLV